MPTVAIINGKVFIVIRTRDEHKPPHVHVYYPRISERAEAKAKIRLDGTVISNEGFSSKTLKKICEHIILYHDRFLGVWNEYNEEEN